MKRAWKIYFSLAALMALLPGALGAQTTQPQRIEKLDELTFSEMLNSVEVGKGEKELVRQFQQKEGQNRLRKDNAYLETGPCDVELYRNKEVIIVSIPASVLFYPNSTELRPDADPYLLPLRRYLKDPDMYRVLLTMHTDNTGSEDYREMLTQERVDAVFDWFDNRGLNTTYLFPYSFSDDMPLKENNSLENRSANRRLEVYLVPGEKMVQQAKRGRIVF